MGGRPWLRRSDACGRARGVRRGPCGRRSWPGAHGSHGGACAPVSRVDKSASRLFSADNLPAKPAICLINEVCAPMRAGPGKRAVSGPMGRPARAGSSRTIGAAYKGGPPFRQCRGAAEPGFFATTYLARIIQWLRCITSGEVRALGPAAGGTAGPTASVISGVRTDVRANATVPRGRSQRNDCY